MREKLTSQQMTLVRAIIIVTASLIFHGCPSSTSTNSGTGLLGRYTYEDAMRNAEDDETLQQLRRACGANRQSAECRNAVNLARVANSATSAPASGVSTPCHDCDDDAAYDGRMSVINTPPADMDQKTEMAFKDYVAKGGDPIAFKQALCYLKKHKDSPKRTGFGNYQMNPCILSIQNNSKSEHVFRRSSGGVAHTVGLFRVNLCEGKTKKGITAMGFGGQCNDAEMCRKGSDKTPHGFVMLGGEHKTDYSMEAGWGPGIKMWGLESYNKNNNDRGVVFHRAKSNAGYYCGNTKDPQGNPICTGRTAGCTGTTKDMWEEYAHLKRARPSGGAAGVGELHYNFSTFEKNKGEDYCGSN
jgi:hypothetical protein